MNFFLFYQGLKIPQKKVKEDIRMRKVNFFCVDRMETGNRIYQHRKAMHFSREELAARLADMGTMVSVNSIGNWERGDVEISFYYAKSLAQIFGCRLYGELVVYHLREFDGERDQLDPRLKAYIWILFRRMYASAYVRFSFCSIEGMPDGKKFYFGWCLK